MDLTCTVGGEPSSRFQNDLKIIVELLYMEMYSDPQHRRELSRTIELKHRLMSFTWELYDEGFYRSPRWYTMMVEDYFAPHCYEI